MQTPSQIQALATALGGLPVLGALPGSPARKAGLRYGDVLLSLNGIATRTIEDFLRARDTSALRLELLVFRDGAERNMVLQLRDEAEPETCPPGRAN